MENISSHLFHKTKKIDKEFENTEEINSSEDEEDQEKKHIKLLETINSLDGKRRRKLVTRTEPSITISEYNLTEGKEKVKLHELVASLKDTATHGSIKKQLGSTVRRRKILPVPLNSEEAEKINRKLAYTKVSKEVSLWNNIVETNRVAEQIVFPLKSVDISIQPASEFVKRFQHKTPLEIEIAKILNSSDNVLTKDSILTPAEEKALKSMSLEEAKRRHNELQKSRALLSYAEAKARRQNKIKSKKYHRILKREKLHKQMKDFEELQKENPDLAAEKLREIEKHRILERMTLKHKNTGKWAKHRLLRAKYDKNVRDDLSHQLELSNLLTQKIQLPSNDSDDDNDKATTNKQANQNNSIKSIINENYENICKNPVISVEEIKNQKNFEQKTKKKITKKSISQNIENSLGKVEKSLLKSQKTMMPNDDNINDGNDTESENEKESLIVETLERKQTMEDFDHMENEDYDTLLKWRKTNKIEQNQNDLPDYKSNSYATKHNNPIVPIQELISQTPAVITVGEKELDDVCENDKLNIEEAFEDDEIAKEFKTEKLEAIQTQKPEDINTFLPGWGAWGGTSIKVSRRKKRRFIIKAPPAPVRKDSTLGNVIINENQNEKIRQLQVSEIPFPFKTKEQFESSIRQPVGNIWNPETAFQKLIAPKVVTKMGQVIEPIDADALLKKSKNDNESTSERKKSNKKSQIQQRRHNVKQKVNQKKQSKNI